MYRSKLPADPISLILGIVSLGIVFLGCCCGPFVIVSLGLSIVGLVMASKSLKEFDQNPDAYTYESRNNANLGKIVCIISTVASAIFTIVMLGAFMYYGKVFSDVLQEVYHQKQINQYTVQDTLSQRNSDFEIDTLAVDTIQIDTIK